MNVGPGGIEPASGVYKTPALPLSYGPASTNSTKKCIKGKYDVSKVSNGIGPINSI